MLSKTAAKRQAHRESFIYRSRFWPAGGWCVSALTYEISSGLAFADARRELAAWRAARVRELMGGETP